MKNINSARIMFFVSQILYQSMDYYHYKIRAIESLITSNAILAKSLKQTATANAIVPSIQSQLFGDSTHNVEFGQFWIRQALEYTSFEIGTIILVVLLLIGLYGLFQYFLLRKPSYALQITQYFGFPVSYLIMSENFVFEKQILNLRFILFRMLPIIVISVITLLKIVNMKYYHRQRKYNQFVKFDNYYPLFLNLRIILMITISNIVSNNSDSPGNQTADSQVLIYFLLIFQLASTFYKAFALIYYFPETQWCSIVTQFWGWISILKYVLKVKEMHNSSLNIFILILAYVYLNPNNCILIVLEKKMQRLINKNKRQRKCQYHVYVFVYYLNMEIRNSYRFLQNCWSNSFRLFIRLKLHEKQYQIKQYFEQNYLVQNSTYQMMKLNLSNNRSRKKQFTIIFNSNYSETDSQRQCKLRKQYEKSLKKLLRYLQQKGLTETGKHQFETIYFMCYILLQIQQIKPLCIYELYYRLQVEEQDKSIFVGISLDIMYGLIKAEAKAKQYLGTFIQQIIRYNQFNSKMQQYIDNQHKFYSLCHQVQLDLNQYRSYLIDRIKYRGQLQSILKVLQFMYPNNQILIMKNYLLQRYVHNNQIRSQQELLFRMNKIKAKKTKIINFSQSLLDHQLSIFIVGFLENRGYISFSNKNFQNTIQLNTKSDISIKVKDILPSFWKDAHQDKIQNLDQLQNNYEHNQDTVYYIESLVTHRFMQVTQLKVIPYFQLSNSLYLMTKMKINKQKQLLIISQQKIQKMQMEAQKRKRRTSKVSATLIEKTNIIGNQTKQTKSNKKIKVIINQEDSKVGQRNRITFKHDVFDDQQHNTIDQTEKIIKVFDKQYLICTRSKCQKFYTKNILQQNSQQNQILNEEINALIKMGLSKKNWQCQVLQKSKKKVNIFKNIYNSLITKLVGASLLLMISVPGISQSFRYYHFLKTRSMMLQLHFRQAFISTVSFQPLLITMEQHIVKKFPTYRPQYDVLFEDDNKVSSQVYQEYTNYIYSLASASGYEQSIFALYLSIDFDSYYKNNNTIIEHVSKFNTLLESSKALIAQKMLDDWVLGHFSQVTQNMSQMYYDSAYFENKFIQQSGAVLNSKIADSNAVFYVFIVFVILCPLLLYFIFWRTKKHIQTVLCKPLFMTKTDRILFKNNYRAIQQYLYREKRTNDNIIGQQIENNLYMSNRKVKPVSNIKHSKSKQNKDREIKPFQQQQQKQITKQFFNPLPFAVLSLGFFLIMMLMCNRYLLFSQTQQLLNLPQRLQSYNQFGKLNIEMFGMYNEMLQYIVNQENLEDEQKGKSRQRINIAKKYINQIQITEVLTKMSFDASITDSILFADPSTYIEDLNETYRKINPYPIQLSLFFSNFYNLQSLFFNKTGYTDQKAQLTLYETFICIRTLKQLSHHIISINYENIYKKRENHLTNIALSYIGHYGFIILVLFQISRMLFIGRKYGQQFLNILPSSSICQSKVFQFQINSIIYRTNFAKDLPHL